MARRTVRLDAEAARALRALQADVRRLPSRSPYEVWAGLDLGPGGYAVVPSEAARDGVREAIRRKHSR